MKAKLVAEKTISTFFFYSVCLDDLWNLSNLKMTKYLGYSCCEVFGNIDFYYEWYHIVFLNKN